MSQKASRDQRLAYVDSELRAVVRDGEGTAAIITAVESLRESGCGAHKQLAAVCMRNRDARRPAAAKGKASAFMSHFWIGIS